MHGSLRNFSVLAHGIFNRIHHHYQYLCLYSNLTYTYTCSTGSKSTRLSCCARTWTHPTRVAASLLQLSVLLNAVDGRGELPLDLALRDKQTSLAKSLVDHGADVDATDARGWTLLHCAIERGESAHALEYSILHFYLIRGHPPSTPVLS